MLRAEILSGAPFRAVLRSAAVFVVILAVMSALAVRLIDRSMTEEIRQSVAEMEATLVDVDRGEGAAELRNQVEVLSRSALGATFVHAVYDRAGRHVAGNVELRPEPGLWQRRVLVPWRRSGAAPETYLVHAVETGDGLIVTGRSLGIVGAAERSALRGLIVTGVAVVLAMLGFGYLVSHDSQVKLERIEATLDLVAQGETGARIGAGDGTEQIDRISRRIDARLDALEALMAATRRTAASVAHDLRRPLARVRLSLERAQGGGAAGRAALEGAIADLDALTAVIGTILRIARIEAGEAGDMAQRVDLAALLAELAETYAPVAEDAGQTLAVAAAAGTLRGDRGMIAQMLVNLIQNAISHAGPGAAITLGAASVPGGGVAVEVADTGRGIAPGQMGEVLEPFFRADAARTGEGSGLGLPLVKAIAARHGAALELADNDPGLRVRVTFPG